MSVHYKKDGIATFDATTEKVFKYMGAGNNPHAAFKSHRLVDVSDNVVTVDAEIYNPDGSTFETTIQHSLIPQRDQDDDDRRGIRRSQVRPSVHAGGRPDESGRGR